MVPAFYALFVRMKLPESVRFLESKGRHAEAEDIVASFEAEAEAEGKELPENAAAPTYAEEDVTSSSIWSRSLRGRTAALWTIWFCVNLLLRRLHLDSVAARGRWIYLGEVLQLHALIITLAQLPGYAAAAWLIETWGRRPTLAAFLVGSACRFALRLCGLHRAHFDCGLPAFLL